MMICRCGPPKCTLKQGDGNPAVATSRLVISRRTAFVAATSKSLFQKWFTLSIPDLLLAWRLNIYLSYFFLKGWSTLSSSDTKQCVPRQYCSVWISLPEELKACFTKLICWRGSTVDNKNSSTLMTSFGGVSQSAAGVLQVHRWRICVFTWTDKSDMSKWTKVKDATSHTLTTNIVKDPTLLRVTPDWMFHQSNGLISPVYWWPSDKIWKKVGPFSQCSKSFVPLSALLLVKKKMLSSTYASSSITASTVI